MSEVQVWRVGPRTCGRAKRGGLIRFSVFSRQLCRQAGQNMNALIIYDELEWVLKAGNTLRRALHKANVSLSLEIKPWRTDILKFARAADKALEEAERADFIVFAGVRLDLVAAWFGEWLERWVVRREIEEVALVVINRKTSENFVFASPSWLSKFAANHGLGLIEEAPPPAFSRVSRSPT